MKGSSLGLYAIIGIFLVIIIGVSLLPTIFNNVESIGWNGTATNVTGTQQTLLGLIPLFFVIGLVMTTVVGVKIKGS